MFKIFIVFVSFITQIDEKVLIHSSLNFCKFFGQHSFLHKIEISDQIEFFSEGKGCQKLGPNFVKIGIFPKSRVTLKIYIPLPLLLLR